MPKKCPKFVSEYLIPSLNSERFGSHLKWVDKKNSIFQLSWCHKGDTHWSEGEAQVFVEWDKIKGHYQPNVKEYFTRSKQRFRSLLYKLTIDGQIKNIKSDMKSKKFYCITGVKKLRRKRKPSNADSGIFSTDDMSSDNISLSSEVANDDEMNELCDVVNCCINNLDDHNYCKYLIDNSDFKDTRFEDHEDVALSTFRNECVDTGKKVLAEQNYLYYYNDLNKFDSKEKNVPTDFPQGTFDEGLQTGSENAVFTKNDDSVYELNYCSTSNEYSTPMESTETLNNLNGDIDPVQFEKFLSDLKMEDFSNLKNFWSKILSWQ